MQNHDLFLQTSKGKKRVMVGGSKSPKDLASLVVCGSAAARRRRAVSDSGAVAAKRVIKSTQHLRQQPASGSSKLKIARE